MCIRVYYLILEKKNHLLFTAISYIPSTSSHLKYNMRRQFRAEHRRSKPWPRSPASLMSFRGCVSAAPKQSVLLGEHSPLLYKQSRHAHTWPYLGVVDAKARVKAQKKACLLSLMIILIMYSCHTTPLVFFGFFLKTYPLFYYRICFGRFPVSSSFRLIPLWFHKYFDGDYLGTPKIEVARV